MGLDKDWWERRRNQNFLELNFQRLDMARKASRRKVVRQDTPGDDCKGKASSSSQSISDIIVHPPSRQHSREDDSSQSTDVKMLPTPPTTGRTGNTQLPSLDTTAGTQNNSAQLSPLEIPTPLHLSPPHNLLGIENVPANTPQNIYQRHLATKGRGVPLWIPEASESLDLDYRREGLSIGDVIMLTAYGGYNLLFNICQPPDHPYNIDSVPEGFTPLNPPLKRHDVQRYEAFGANSSLTSDSISKDVGRLGPSGIHFQSSAVEGAILALPNGAVSQDATLRDNIVGWYKYAKEVRGWSIKNGDLRVVVGVDKTSSWGMATFASRTEVRDVQLQFRQIDHPEPGGMYRWEYEGMVNAARVGPSRRQIDALVPSNAESRSQQSPSFENQCIFVRTLNTNLQDDTWETMESEWKRLGIAEGSNQGNQGGYAARFAKPASLLDANFMRSSKGNTPSAGLNQFYLHPSDVINEFLLSEYPNAKLAITNDCDWIAVLKTTDSVLPPGKEILSRLLTSYVAFERDGIVRWETKETTTKDLLYDLNPSTSPARRALSASSIEDLPPYIPRIPTKSNSTPFPHASQEVLPPPYRSSTSLIRVKTNECLFTDSPQGMNTQAGSVAHRLPCAAIFILLSYFCLLYSRYR
ncbi:hypothetical protein BJ912DRAFT_972891 [Pholiota molesta]|nr:hypothetical protein BJ912DRAFT_972891 [Pholiota molesta]